MSQDAGQASIVKEWSGKKESMQSMMRLLQTYKEIGDSKQEVSSGGSSHWARYRQGRSMQAL